MLSNLNVYRSFYQLHQCRSKANQIKLTIHLIIRLTLNQSQLFCDCLLNMCTHWIFLKTMSLDKFHHSQLFHESKKNLSNRNVDLIFITQIVQFFVDFYPMFIFTLLSNCNVPNFSNDSQSEKKITTIKRTESFYHQEHIVSLILIVLGDLFRLRVRESIVCFDSKWLDGLDEKRIAHELCVHHILRWSMWTYWNIYIYLFYL